MSAKVELSKYEIDCIYGGFSNYMLDLFIEGFVGISFLASFVLILANCARYFDPHPDTPTTAAEVRTATEGFLGVDEPQFGRTNAASSSITSARRRLHMPPPGKGDGI
jgi:hypothetical protein